MGFRDLFRKKRCRVCQTAAAEILTFDERQWDYFCRDHLIEEFSRGFMASPFRFVVREFEPMATWAAGRAYGYYPASSLERLGWRGEDEKTLRDLLAGLRSNAGCIGCGANSSQTLYLTAAAASWNEFQAGLDPRFAQIGQRLCLKCALERLRPVLETNPRQFDDCGGLGVPFGEDGYFVTTEC